MTFNRLFREDLLQERSVKKDEFGTIFSLKYVWINKVLDLRTTDENFF